VDCRAYAVRRLVVVVLPLFDFLQQRTTWGGEKRSSSRIRNKSTDIRLRCAGNNHFVDCLFGLFVVCAFELREQRPKLDSPPLSLLPTAKISSLRYVQAVLCVGWYEIKHFG